MISLAPSLAQAKAVAQPMPEAPPVTSVTFPANRPAMDVPPVFAMRRSQINGSQPVIHRPFCPSNELLGWVFGQFCPMPAISDLRASLWRDCMTDQMATQYPPGLPLPAPALQGRGLSHSPEQPH